MTPSDPSRSPAVGERTPACVGDATGGPAQTRPSPWAEVCWRRVGVWGNGACPQLAQQSHCRSCPVFAAAAAEVLDRPLPKDYRRDWTSRVSVAGRSASPADTAVVLFRIGVEWLALDTGLVQEVTGPRPMHSLPHRHRDLVLGLANVRGELVPCLALGRLMGLEYDGPAERLRRAHRHLLVLESGRGRLAFPADEVVGVWRFSRQDMRPLPGTVARARRVFTRGILEWRQRAVGYLDSDAVLFHLERSLA